jgi:hypothetical protein
MIKGKNDVGDILATLGGPTARRHSYFKRVMKVITQLISQVQEKLADIAPNGTLDASPLQQQTAGVQGQPFP